MRPAGTEMRPGPCVVWWAALGRAGPGCRGAGKERRLAVVASGVCEASAV